MSREANERTFAAALSNEYQWRNLYLKEFGCCTYAPPMPKDPSTTADAVYPTRRQVGLLQRESSSSSESGDIDLDSDLEEMGVARVNSDLGTDPGEQSGFLANSNVNLSRSILSKSGVKSSTTARPRWRHQSNNSEAATSTGAATTSFRSGGGELRRRQSTADQFFSLDMSASESLHPSMPDESRRNAHHSTNSNRRSRQSTVLRKDDFFDTTDVLSTRFFSFLWVAPEDEQDTDDPDASEGRTTEDDGRRQGALEGGGGGGRHGHLNRHNMHGSNDSQFLTLSRPNLSTLANHAFDTNPRGLPDAILRLHHQTWALLMDNRLMAWVHRETVDHCQSATQLRQRLLEIIARGPASFAGVGAGGAASYAASVQPSSALALPQEDALQRTLESFSPFFVVISPPAAVQRATDQLQTARRNQQRNNASPQHATAVAAADLIGLPLLSQYGTWREAYEHRRRWDKAPFSFFLLHDVSYNFTQVTALFIELQLLYVHAHNHTQQCIGRRRESVLLQQAGRHLASHAGSPRTADDRQHVCPLLLMQETTENIVVAFEQSSSRATLPMLRRVLDFLTDAALDAVTAHRFVSREALLRQHQFELPGMTTARRTPPASMAVPLSTSAPLTSLGDLSGAAASATSEVTMEPAPLMAAISHSPFADTRSDKLPSSPGMQELYLDDGGPSTPVVFPEPQRVTERDINGLFELAYWFVDAATANARVPIDAALLAGTAADAGAALSLGARVASGRLGGGAAGAAPGSSQPSTEASPEQLHLNPSEPSHNPAATAALSPTELVGRRSANSPVPVSGVPSRPISAPGERGATQPGAAAGAAGRPPQYLPGRVQVHPPVESLAEAVALLEAYRKPTRARDERGSRGGRGSAGRRKRQSVQVSEGGLRNLSPASPALPSPLISPVPALDALVGFVSPLVVLTTYLRLHGGPWLKQLCTRVFETLRRPSLVLYVNTLELDAAWSALLPPPAPQPPSPTASEGLKYGGGGGGNGGAARVRLRRRSTVSTAASAAARPPSANTAAAAAAAEAARTEFLSGLSRLEDLICQDIVLALNDFFGNLYGRRAAAGRLPQGICVLLTQFVSTMHLYMLESVGATRAAAAAAAASGNANRNRAARPMQRGSPGGSNAAGPAEEAPSRLVEDCLRVCKQRYYAGLRRRGGANEARESFAYTARDVDGLSAGLGGSGGMGSAAAATSSLPRLLQTIEQHRLAKFILFDCWILPALNNASSLGYLASDSPLHLRWNIDALARYLKVLVHAPFVEQDKQNFASLAPTEPAEPRGRRESGGMRRQGLRGGADRRAGRSRPAAQNPARGAARPAVLSLPPYLTGIYDVVTGSLVRVQTALPSPARKPSQSMSLVMSEAGDTLASPTVMRPSPNALPSPVDPTVLTRIGGGRRDTMVSLLDSPLSLGQTEDDGSVLSGDEVSLREVSPSQWGQSKRTIAATAVPPSVAATHEAPTTTATRTPTSRVRRASATKGGKSTLPARSASSSRLFSTEEEEAAAAAAGADLGLGSQPRPPGLYRDTGSFAGMPLQPDDSPFSGARLSSPSRRRRAESDTLDSVPRGGAGAGRRAPPPLDYVDGGMSGGGGAMGNSLTSLTHPYVVMDDAVWLDMSPALQSLNDSVGLTACDRGGVEAVVGDQEMVSPIPRLPKLHHRADSTLQAAAASTSGRGGGPGGLHARGHSVDSSTLADLSYFDVPALQMLDAFAYAACTDDSDYVVVSEFEVLPSMAAGCLERLYELTTDTHPMVLHALQSGVFHLAFDHHDAAHTRTPTGLTSLYSACLNGVLLHPRTAAHVLKNVMDNNVPFSETLLKPVSDATALNLLGQLASHSRDIPMVDVNAVVPLLQSMVPARGGGVAAGRMLQAAGSPLPRLGPQGATPATAAAKSAAVARHWERESRRLLREFVFLTTGYSDYGPPMPLAPGLHRPVGPPHPIQMIRAGATRITADTGGVTPMVFDPWWRAMVVALCVKTSNMFAECGGEQAATFETMRHAYAEDTRRVHRHTSAHFVSSKGRETGEKDLGSVASFAGKRESLSMRLATAAAGAAAAPPGRKLKKKAKAASTNTGASGTAAAARNKVKKPGTRKSAASAV